MIKKKIRIKKTFCSEMRKFRCFPPKVLLSKAPILYYYVFIADCSGKA